MNTDRNQTIECSRGHGSVELPPNLKPDELKKLKAKAADIWEECRAKGIGYLCKCKIADLINGDLDEQSESDGS